MMMRFLIGGVWKIINQQRCFSSRMLFVFVAGSLAGCSQFSTLPSPVDWMSSPLKWIKSSQGMVEDLINDLPIVGNAKQRTTYPKLSSVPSLPKQIQAGDERDKIRNQLLADRENARYVGTKSKLWPHSMPFEPDLVKSIPRDKAIEYTKRLEQSKDGSGTKKPTLSPIKQAGRVVKELKTLEARAEPLKPPRSLKNREERNRNKKFQFKIPVAAKNIGNRNTEFKFRIGEKTSDNPIQTILFAHGSHILSKSDRRLLMQIARKAIETGSTVRVTGHASMRTKNMDELRHTLANFNISVKRANTVAAFLIRNGVPGEKLLVDAVGDSQPLNFESMPSEERANRRAEISLEPS